MAAAPGTAACTALPGGGGTVFDSRARIPQIIEALEQIREGIGPDGNWMIDVHQKFDFHEAVEVCKLMEPYCGPSASRIRFAKSSSGRRSRSCG